MLKSILDTIIRGGPVIIPIFAVSLVAWALAIDKYFLLKKENIDAENFADKVIRLLKVGRTDEALSLCAEENGTVPAGVAEIIKSRKRGKEFLANKMRQIFHEKYPYLEKNIQTIGVLAKTAPLLGLLGTVTGMVSTFTSISVHGTGDPQALAGGISEALITTQSGLVVAIPILFFQEFLIRKVDGIMKDLEKVLTRFVNFIGGE